MIWELSQDVTAQGQPLLEAIDAVMNTATRAPQRNSDFKDFALYDNYPNPFNPSTTIRFALSQRAHVSIKVFNVLGEEVATLVDELRDAGSYSVQLDASELRLASGMYFYQINTGTFAQTKKLVLVR
jgi:hypothetical protein